MLGVEILGRLCIQSQNALHSNSTKKMPCVRIICIPLHATTRNQTLAVEEKGSWTVEKLAIHNLIQFESRLLVLWNTVLRSV